MSFHLHQLPRAFTHLFIILVLVVLTPELLQATQPLSHSFNELWSEPFGGLTNSQLSGISVIAPRRDLDDYIGKFMLLCEFLATMQERDPESPDYGGMHEGESDQLWAIIESDNTQEAIRVWCEYAAKFDDPDTYRDYITAAWQYLENYPAWEEGPPLYYSLHNDGWGLIAEMGFRDIYGDERQEYGRHCAEDIIDTAPEITPDMEDRLMPLVAGWAAGTLYLYGIYEDNDEYKAFAEVIAGQVKGWIEADNNRLNNNEIWALCGGTAMWGVLNSLGSADSAATADWAIEALDEMDVFAGRGQWNNSWNIWYAHSWLSAWKLTGDDVYLSNAVAIVDSLLAQDGDADGGIPATGGDQDDEDQSWVTAYTGWMGLSNLMDILPEFNVGVAQLLTPSLDRPYPVGAALTLGFEIRNISFTSSYESPFRIRGALEVDTTIRIDGWGTKQYDFIDIWTPIDTGWQQFTAYSDHPDDGDRSDDTLRFNLEIKPIGDVILEALDAADNPIPCRFDFYSLDFDTGRLFFSIATSEVQGRVDTSFIVGRYRLAAVPEFPYPVRTYPELYISAGGDANEITPRFNVPPVLLLNNDLDTNYTRYYEEALQDADVEFYRWDMEPRGEISLHSVYFNTILYYTGDRDLNTLPTQTQGELEEQISRGGRLFVTGQNITDEWAGEPELEELLHVRHLTDDISRSSIDGTAGDELMDGLTLLLIGNQGAGNQSSPAGVAAVNGGIACGFYHDAPDTAGVIRWKTEEGGKGIFFAFGFEGISGMGHTSSRETVMRAALEWLGTHSAAAPVAGNMLQPGEPSLGVYPNPANGAVIIRYSPGLVPLGGLTIYDLGGRSVRRLKTGAAGVEIWDGLDKTGRRVPSGIYFIRPELVNGGDGQSVKLVLLR